MNEKDILKLFACRDERALEAVKEEYESLCFLVAFNILHDNEDAEECVNDTYMSLWKETENVLPDNLKAYICKLARNIAFKKLEYNTAQKRSRDITVSISELEYAIGDEYVDKNIDEAELGSLISSFLKTQKKDVRAVFIQRFFYYYSYEDIAKKYSFSLGKVKTIIHRAKKELKKYLENEGVHV